MSTEHGTKKIVQICIDNIYSDKEVNVGAY